jgi:hypothetical protein
MGVYRGPVQDVLFVPVRISLPPADMQKLRSRGLFVPAPIDAQLVIDTGSLRSTLTPSVLRHLQCPSRHSVRVQTSMGEGQANYYEVGMEFLSSTMAPLPSWEVLYCGPRRWLTIRDRSSFWGWLCS